MSAFMLLIWISLLVILNVRGESNISDNNSICEHCNIKTLPDCSTLESSTYNFTISCHQVDVTPCIIAVVIENTGTNETEHFCLLSERIELLQNSIESSKLSNLVESEATAESPIENASVEELKIEVETTTIEHLKEETTEMLKEVPVEEISNKDTEAQQETIENAEAEVKPSIDVDEMPQADQPMPESETNVDKVTEIEDNKLETAVVVEEKPAETPTAVDAKENSELPKVDEDTKNIEIPKTDDINENVESRMNTIEATVNMEGNSKKHNCFGCVSTSEPNCVTKPTKIISCNSLGDEEMGCFTMQQDTYIERGCLQNLDEHQLQQCRNITSNTKCTICNQNFCNNQVFPIEPKFCHQCIGTAECALEQLPNHALPCPLNNSDEACFFFADDNDKMYRGCKSNSELYDYCQTFDEKRCITCTDHAGCNSQSLKLKPKFSCISCDSRIKDTKTIRNCEWAQSIKSATNCQNEYRYYLEESCISMYIEEIELTIRGCSLDIGACEPTNPDCFACYTNACNFQNLIHQRCSQCSSDVISSCSSDARSIESELCKTDIQTFNERGCYSIINSIENVTTRGCLSDLTAEGKDYCKANKNLCIFCYKQDCNNQMAPSRAEKYLNINFGIILLGLYFSL